MISKPSPCVSFCSVCTKASTVRKFKMGKVKTSLPSSYPCLSMLLPVVDSERLFLPHSYPWPSFNGNTKILCCKCRRGWCSFHFIIIMREEDVGELNVKSCPLWLSEVWWSVSTSGSNLLKIKLSQLSVPCFGASIDLLSLKVGRWRWYVIGRSFSYLLLVVLRNTDKFLWRRFEHKTLSIHR